MIFRVEIVNLHKESLQSMLGIDINSKTAKA